MKKILIITFAILALILASCAPAVDPTPTPEEVTLTPEEPTPTPEEPTPTPEEPTPTPEEPTPTPTPDLAEVDPAEVLGPPDWVDDMATAANWVELPNEFTEIEFQDGQLQLTALGLLGWRLAHPTLGDFYLEYTIQSPNCTGSDNFGMVFRSPVTAEAEQVYLYGITCDGRYSLRRWDEDEMNIIIPLTASDAIEPGASTENTIGLMAIGPQLSLYINGELVDEAFDDTWLFGHFGVFVDSEEVFNVEMWVDQVRYWEDPEIAPVEPTPTPAPITDEDPAAELGPPDWIDDMAAAGNWVTAPSEFSDIAFQGGYLRMSTHLQGWRLGHPVLDNFYLEYTGFSPDCAGGDNFGMVFRSPVTAEAQQVYLFGITCNGSYSLRRWDEGNMILLVPWTPSDVIETGANAANVIGVMAQGPQLGLYINGYLVDEVTDATWLEGHIGVYVENAITDNVSFWVDQVRYWELP